MTDITVKIKQMIIDELELEDMSVDDIETDAPLFGEGLGLDSIGAARVDLPLVKTACFDDTGRKSLLIGEKRDELAVYAPAQGRLFEREPTRFSMPLPRDGARARVLDLDHGLAQELVLPFDAQDDAAHRNQVLLLRLVEEHSGNSSR